MTKAERWRLALRAIAVILSVAVLVVLVQSLRRDGPAALAAWRSANVSWTWVVLAVACGFVGHAVYVIGWRRLLSDSGITVPLWPLARIFLVSNLGRYLPGGKAWQMGIVGMMAGENGLPAAAVAASSLLQGVVGVGVGAIVLFWAGGATLGVAAPWLALPVAGVAGLLLAPAILRSLPRVREAVARRFKGIDTVTIGTMWALIWTSAAAWIMWGLALYALAIALLAAPAVPISSYIAAWTGSFLAGLLAVVSPAGLGAREGIMQAVLEKSGMLSSDVLIVVIVSRVWVTILDVVPAAVVLLFRRRGRMTVPPPPA